MSACSERSSASTPPVSTGFSRKSSGRCGCCGIRSSPYSAWRSRRIRMTFAGRPASGSSPGCTAPGPSCASTTLLPGGRRVVDAQVVPRLHGTGAILRVYDPAAARKLEKLYPPDDRLTYVDSAFEAVRDAHALVILTDWEEFRSLDLGRVGSYMRTPIVVDGRNLFEPAQMQAAGLEYYSLGRGEATFHGAETDARMSVRRRSSVTVTRGQNSQVPV